MPVKSDNGVCNKKNVHTAVMKYKTPQQAVKMRFVRKNNKLLNAAFPP